MRTTIVPAQITTVEDTIAGNLTLNQLILLVIPVFSTVMVLVICPPFLKLSIYKLVISFVIALPPIALSIRVKGQVAFRLVRLALTYRIRPRIYLLTGSSSSCSFCLTEEKENDVIQVQEPEPAEFIRPLDDTELKELGEILTDRSINFYANKKGGFNAVIE